VNNPFGWGVVCGVAIGFWIASIERDRTAPRVVRIFVTVDDVTDARRDTVQKMAEGGR